MKTIYVDMDDVLCAFTKASNEHIRLCPDIKFPQSQYGFFRGLEPIDGGIEFMQRMLRDPCYDIYILTAPSTYNPLCYTEKAEWVKHHLGMAFVERLIISPNKSLLIGDYLIDDHVTGRGQDKFIGELIHFKNWNDVNNIFKEE